MQGGIAVVKYDCTTLKLLEDCHVDGTYGFKGIVLEQQVVRLDDADEVKVNLPLSGGVLAANLEGTAGRGSSLDLATALVGNRVSTRMTVTKADLSGACDEAKPDGRGRTTWLEAKAYCAKLDLSGGGWRLPTKDELTALYQSKSNTPGTSWYWSSTQAGRPSEWSVAYINDYADSNSSIHDTSVRCVRGAAVTNPALPTPALPTAAAASGGETLRVAGLVWQAKPDARDRTWADAKAYCAKLDLAGSGWRLPTKEELKALYNSNTPRTHESADYWSSSVYGSGASKAWLVNFNAGYVDADATGAGRARCVR